MTTWKINQENSLGKWLIEPEGKRVWLSVKGKNAGGEVFVGFVENGHYTACLVNIEVPGEVLKIALGFAEAMEIYAASVKNQEAKCAL